MSDPLSEALRPYLAPPPLIRVDRATMAHPTYRRMKEIMSQVAARDPRPAQPRDPGPWGVPVFITDEVPHGLILFVTEKDGVVGEVEIDMGSADYG